MDFHERGALPLILCWYGPVHILKSGIFAKNVLKTGYFWEHYRSTLI